ncbi:hypothetical protein ENUP19_0229G0034 [Entamoeba nuttalli]|uniref:Uncharacterized protein n=1 Tax=Entamoeba nuttalli TaxID=412467 RepID=A0ABQ0DQ30_9EUKA
MNIKLKKKLRKEEIKRILEEYHIDITIEEYIKIVKRSKGIKKENIEYINNKVNDMIKEEDNIENEKIREINRKKKKKEIDIEYIKELIKKSKRKQRMQIYWILFQ